MKTDNIELTVVLPVYNEKDSIAKVVSEWIEQLKKITTFEIIICEDGSTDGTKKVLKLLAKRYKELTVNSVQYRRGYGLAVLAGIKEAKGKYVLCIDSDGQCDPSDLPLFWKNRNLGKVMIGWRTTRIDSNIRKAYSRIFRTLFNLLFPNRLHDPSAPFVLFSRRKILPLLSELEYLKEGFWWGFVGACLKRKIKIEELPINHRARVAGQTRVYTLDKIVGIARRNVIGLFKLRFSY